MRRPSIKPLSLALSLLLTVAVLFSLSLPVWADTEVPGDLNGDTLVNSEDITILEAVLNGSQNAAAGVNYDISGNKMVDSKDLIVLKHLVDPSQPALVDKLSGGETDDILCLVTSVEGGALQSAVVRGDSTKALELNGSTLTVRFNEVQNWSNVSALTMDTLWLSGDQTLTVSLLDADGNVLGTSSSATAKEAGWSSMELSLPANRAKVGGFTVTAAADAHVYMDNLRVSLEDKYVLTRAEMENALVEMAWNWYFKDPNYQYDSSSLNSINQHLCDPLCGYVGGKSRLSLFPVLENATSHSSVFTVCSSFAYDIYLSALGYPLLGSKYNSLTMTFWHNGSYYPNYVRDAEGAYDMTVLRWHSKGQGTVYSSYDEEFCGYYKDESGNVVYSNWYDADGVREFFANYEENFRPGDIIVFDKPGHTVIYIGNGMVMDVNGAKTVLDEKLATGGGKYDMTTGADLPELAGCVSYRKFSDVFLNPDSTTMNLEEAFSKEENHVVVLRPLNLLTIDDGDDVNSDGDKLNPAYVLNTGLLKYQLEHDTTHQVKTSGYHIDEVTQTRLNYPGMNIDRTVNITPYGTAVKGETITYSVKITNNSADTNYANFKGEGYAPKAYEGLTVVEHIPANTQLEDAPGATVDGDTLTWNITVPAGETVELTYTVTVTGELGDKIVSGGGWVNNIPSNTIENSIGGKKLAADAMADLSTDGITVVDNTDFAEQVYQVTTGHSLQLPKVQELMDIFFSDYEYYTPYGYYLYSTGSGVRRHMYSLNAQAPDAKDQPYYDMLVSGYYGGLWCYTDEYNGEPRINELRTEYLEVGDILVYMDLTEAKGNGSLHKERNVAGSTVMVYLGDGSFASVDADGNLAISSDVLCCTEAFMHDLFVCLRPSQVYDDLNAGLPGYTVTWKIGDTEIVKENVPYLTLPTYEGETPASSVKTHIFTGWSPAIAPVTGDVTYTAVFTDKTKVFTVTWVDIDGTVLETDENVAEGTMPSYDSKAPTKAAANGYTYVFAGWDKEISEVTGNVTYIAAYSYLRDLTSHKLTDSELDALAAITPEMVQEAFACTELTSVNLNYVAPWIYRQAGIYYNAVETGDGDRAGQVLSTYYTAQKFFKLSSQRWTPNATVADPYATMLVASSYGGTQMNDAPTFELGYLQIGDLFCAAYDKAQTNNGKTIYYTYLYQGDGKFLLMGEDSAVYTCEEVLNRIYTYNDTDYNWSYYFVIRPEEYGTPGNRDITLRKLTGAELYRLSKLTTMGYTSRFLYGPMHDYYNAVGIELNFPLEADGTSKISQSMALAKLFKKVSSLYVPVEATNDLMRYFQRMQVSVQGGSQFAAADRVDISDAIENGTLKVGDVIAASHTNTYTLDGVEKSENVPFTAMYQGNNTFLVYYYVHADEATSASMTRTQWTTEQVESLNYLNYFTLRAENIASAHDVTWVNDDGTVLEIDSKLPFFTLPTYDGDTPTKAADLYTYTFAGWDKEVERVTGDVTYKATYTHSRSLTSSKLTEEEMNILANITPEDVKAAIASEEAGANLNTAAPWIYQQANIEWPFVDDANLSIYYTAAKFFSGSTSKWTLRTSVAEPYTSMLVTNAYGGAYMNEAPEFDINYLQVGDLFCGMYTYPNAEGTLKNTYGIYLYQGDGDFLRISSASDVYSLEEVLNSTYTYTDNVDYGWGCYYVIRPENYNSAKRDITLRALTDAERYALSQLTPTQIGFESIHIKGSANKMYRLIGINDFMVSPDGNSLTTGDTRDKLFTTTGARVPVAATTETMYLIQKMMVPCYGGNFMRDTVTLTDAIENGTLQVGDIVAGIMSDDYTVEEVTETANTQFTALYQGIDETGKGKFAIFYYDYLTSTDADGRSSAKVVMYADEIDERTTQYYYTLRPENLATVTEDRYTITWVNEDGTVLETDKSAVGTLPSYDGEVPTKAPTTELAYTFQGWTPVFTSVNADVTYTAVYTEGPRPYTVNWVNADGSVLETDTVPYGTTPAYDGETPTKAAANGYTYTFKGWDVEPAAVTGDVTYTATYSHIRTLTAHLLNEQEMAALAAITADDVQNAGLSGDNITNVISWIYQQASIDISDTVLASKTINSVKGYLFTSSPLVPRTSNASSSAESKILYATYIPMRVAGAYGGTTLNSACVTGLDIASLQVGDLLCAHNGSYYVYLYQGPGDNNEGKFLKVGKTGYGIFTADDIVNADTAWNYYYVIRPDHYNGRPVESAPLTEAEIQALSKLTSYDIGYNSRHIYSILADYYRPAGISVTLPLNENGDGMTHAEVLNQLFTESDGVLVTREDADDYFRKINAHIQGGSDIAEAEQVDISDAIQNGTLKVGDVIAGTHRNTYTVDDTEKTEEVPFSALYQGDGKFLVYYFVYSPSAGKQAMTETTWTTEQVEALNYLYYYTLRIGNLAN